MTATLVIALETGIDPVYVVSKIWARVNPPDGLQSITFSLHPGRVDVKWMGDISHQQFAREIANCSRNFCKEVTLYIAREGDEERCVLILP